jgi:uncharacterized protein
MCCRKRLTIAIGALAAPAFDLRAVEVVVGCLPMGVLSLRENSTWFKIEQGERRHLIHLVVTERCNLSCSYCYQSHDDEITLDYLRMRDTLESVLDRFEGIENVHIRYFGGEPLLAFEQIRKLTAHVKRVWRSRNWPENGLSFGVTTNGTLLDDGVKGWLEENPEVSLSLSLDGTPEMHNANRSNSYSRIEPHLTFFRRYDNPVKMTIGPGTITNCAAGVKHIHALGFECHANLVFEDVWGDETERAELLRNFERQLATLIAFYIQNPAIPRTTLLPVLWKQLPIENEMERWSSGLCGMGRNMTTIGIDGRIYPCSRVIPVFRKGEGAGVDISRTTLRPESCASCALQPVCQDCRAFNYESNGDTNHKTKFHCEFVQLQLRAAALLTIHDIMRIRKERCPEELSGDERMFLAQRMDTALFIENVTRKV